MRDDVRVIANVLIDETLTWTKERCIEVAELIAAQLDKLKDRT